MSWKFTVTTPFRTITATEFKAKCLKLMDEVAETGETILVTKHGEVVAKIAPVGDETPKRKSIFGMHKELIRIPPDLDLTKPIVDPDDVWTGDEDNVFQTKAK
ncbi:MAG: type II toxin-antitoxin system Phd/YefM family antitoxin [Amphiplicatus sp.]